MTGLSGRIGTCILSAVVIVLIGGAGGNEDDGFRPIFDGKTLDGWISDDDPNQFDAAGILGLQLHSGPPTVAQFKDIRVKIINPAE